mmetsp:Transcript_53615/g.125511  ORF Transcript_53615/g.125511 Transcript_53615/m.125511 type:complete len:220 (-) Transcript_53615:655-1314(-)
MCLTIANCRRHLDVRLRARSAELTRPWWRKNRISMPAWSNRPVPSSDSLEPVWFRVLASALISLRSCLVNLSTNGSADTFQKPCDGGSTPGLLLPFRGSELLGPDGSIPEGGLGQSLEGCLPTSSNCALSSNPKTVLPAGCVLRYTKLSKRLSSLPPRSASTTERSKVLAKRASLAAPTSLTNWTFSYVTGSKNGDTACQNATKSHGGSSKKAWPNRSG